MSMPTAGVYLKDVRKTRQLSQAELAEVVDVGRGTIERLEKGDDRVGVGTVVQVIQALGASPWHYYELAVHPALTVDEIRKRQAIIHGIQSYVRTLCERKQIPLPVLTNELRGLPVTPGDGETDNVQPLSELALLMALVYLDAPLGDLAPIIHATADQEALGRQLADERSTFSVQLQHHQRYERAEPRAIPALDTVLHRLAVILRTNHELPHVLRHELSRIVTDLERYRALLGLAMGYIEADS